MVSLVTEESCSWHKKVSVERDQPSTVRIDNTKTTIYFDRASLCLEISKSKVLEHLTDFFLDRDVSLKPRCGYLLLVANFGRLGLSSNLQYSSRAPFARLEGS